MVDWVPVASVVSTAALGIAGNVTQYRLARSSQQHEKELARETRAAEERRDARELRLGIAAWCVNVQRFLTYPSTAIVVRGNDTDAQLLAHGSDALRAAIRAFDEVWQQAQSAALSDLFALKDTRTRKDAALDSHDFDGAASARMDEIERDCPGLG